MSVVIDIKPDFVEKFSFHGWNKRLKQMAASLGFRVVEIQTSSLDQNFICRTCRSDSEHCNCSVSNPPPPPHTLVNIDYQTMNNKVQECDCEFLCKCGTTDVV